MKKYSGAGVIPILIKNNKPYMILFTYQRGIITDAGGKIESNNTITETASRELFEESAGLININNNILEDNSVYVDIKYNNTYYRTHIILIQFPDESYEENYNNNLQRINKFKFNPFSETRGIRLISLDYIHFVDNNILMNTNTDKVEILANRTKDIIKKIHKISVDLVSFYRKIKDRLKIIKLNKKNISVQSYEYDSEKPIEIKNLINYFA
jgi:ADP-ribose pyrophosphatase YjhB (NUDIX family)